MCRNPSPFFEKIMMGKTAVLDTIPPQNDLSKTQRMTLVEPLFVEQTAVTELADESLSRKIELIIDQLPPHQVTLMEIVELVGEDGLLLLTIILSLIFLVPVSIPGISTVFGSGIILIGLTRLLNRRPWLPKAIGARQLATDKLREGLRRALAGFYRLEKVSHPHRLPWMTRDGVIMRFNNLCFIVAGVLLMIPFGFIPFSNTLPAVALIFLALGMMQRDGGSILLGNLAIVVSVTYFSIILTAGGLSLLELARFLN